MEKIRKFLYKINRRAPVLVPRVIRDMVTRYSAHHLTYSVDNINNVLECLTLLFSECRQFIYWTRNKLLSLK